MFLLYHVLLKVKNLAIFVLYSHNHDQLYKHIIHIHLHMHAEYNDTIVTSNTVLRKIYLALYWKGCVWEGVGDRTELQNIDPHSIGHNCVLPVLLGCSTGGLRAHSAGCWISLPHLVTNGSGLQTDLISNCNCSIRGLRAHSAGCWISLPHLVTNGSGLQTDLISNCNCSIRGLRAHSAGCWISLPHLVTNGSGLQTDLISNCNCSIRGLRAHSAGCWISLPHLVSN